MDTSRIQTADAELDAVKAIGRLEQANKRLLECPSSDVNEIDTAMAERDEAVRAIAAADTSSLEEPVAERLLRAFEDGRGVRRKLVALYRGFDAELKRIERIRAGDAKAPEPPGISAIG
jgi:hypothetical protein